MSPAWLIVSVSALLPFANCESILDSWWTYDPNSVENWKQGEKWVPDWKICGDGRRQSPVNIDTDKLVYSPSLRPLSFNFNKVVSASVRNTGQNIVIRVESPAQDSKGGDDGVLTVANGPLSYTYQITTLVLKFGLTDEGSEHRINNQSFPGELQLFGFNSDLFETWDDAQIQPHGLVALSIFIAYSDSGASQLESIMKEINQTQFKGESSRIAVIDFSGLLPDSDHYLTYEGSLPFPACYETVSWIILNAPIHVTLSEVETFRRASRLRREDDRKVSLANNFRAIKELNRRTVLTNINFRNWEETDKCDMQKDTRYSLSTY